MSTYFKALTENNLVILTEWSTIHYSWTQTNMAVIALKREES